MRRREGVTEETRVARVRLELNLTTLFFSTEAHVTRAAIAIRARRLKGCLQLSLFRLFRYAEQAHNADRAKDSGERRVATLAKQPRQQQLILPPRLAYNEADDWRAREARTACTPRAHRRCPRYTTPPVRDRGDRAQRREQRK